MIAYCGIKCSDCQIQLATKDDSEESRIEVAKTWSEKFGWNLKPEDIDMVIHTHLHNDHCENDYKCVNAEIYVHEKELERIHDPHPLDFRYLEDYIEDVEENGQVKTVSGDSEIHPGIRVVHTQR